MKNKTFRSLFLLLTVFVGTGLVLADSVVILLGDVNRDGEVNVADILAIINYVNGSTDGLDATAADVNRDGEHDIADISGVTNIVHYGTPSRSTTESILFFTTGSVEKTYGDAAFSTPIIRAGSRGTISYSAFPAGVVEVAADGTVTIVGAGTATITATLAANGTFGETTASYTVTISKAAATNLASTMTTAVTAKKDGEANQSYTGGELPLVNAGESSAGTLKYKVTTSASPAPSKTDNDWSTDVPSATAAGTYYVWYYAEGNDNYNETAVSATPIEVTIDKATPTMTTAPALAVGDLSYTGEPQALTSAADGVTGGTVKYFVSTENTAPTTESIGWTTEVPEKADAGTYYVWYYVDGADNYNDTAVQSLGSKTISKASATTDPSSTMTTAVTAKKDGEANQSYTGDELPLVNAGESSAGTLKYKVTTSAGPAPSKTDNDWSTDVPTATDAGTYFVWYYAEGNDNYNETAVSATPIEVTIDKATPTMTTAPALAVGDLSYTGEAQALTSAADGVTGGTVKYFVSTENTAPTTESIGWTTEVPTGKDVGNYYVWYYVDGADNYNDTAVQSLGSKTISKAAATTDPSSTMTTAVTAKKNGEANQSYTGSALDLVNAGVSKAGTLKYQMTTTNSKPEKGEGTWSTDVPTATNAGTYYVWYYAEGNDNYNETVVSANPIEVTIAKANISPSVSMNGWTYGGTASSPSVSGNTGSGGVTYQYKVSTAADNTYSSTRPSNAGTYTVKATIAATTNYNGNTATTNFTIAKAVGAATLSASSVTYGTAAGKKTVTVSGNTGTVSATIKITSGSGCTVSVSGTTITINRSTNAAALSATITVTIAASTNYNSTTKTISVSGTAATFTSMNSAKTADVGKIICSNGHIHTNVSDVTCGGVASGMLGYVGISTGNSDYKNGLVISLSDASYNVGGYPQTYYYWSELNNSCKSYSTKRPSASSAWAMTTHNQLNDMMNACGGYANLRDMKGRQSSACGGTAMQSGVYWTSTYYSGDSSYWGLNLSNGVWGNWSKTGQHYARACFAF